ncbi:MAG TPA: hypothetical protein ENJ19_10095 [Gammaproteobacteria bacterium]|nr:hypothetical protein [Gammaproteobacteria bacterium]
MSSDEQLIVGSMAAIAAAVSFVLAFVYLRRARLIQDTPTSKVRSAAQGFVELQGRAVLLGGEPIVAPLSRLPCAWYAFRVERRAHGDRGPKWRVVERGVSDALFGLEDETGRCVIDPEGAAVTPAQKEVWYGEFARPVLPLASEQGLHASFRGEYRYTEERIHVDDNLYALGFFQATGGAAEPLNLRETTRELLAQWKRDQSALLARFDRNGDGAIDLEEWDEARRAAAAEARELAARRLQEPAVPVLSKPANRRQPFLLSVHLQHGLARRYTLYATAAFVLSLLAGGAAVWLLPGA